MFKFTADYGYSITYIKVRTLFFVPSVIYSRFTHDAWSPFIMRSESTVVYFGIAEYTAHAIYIKSRDASGYL